MKHRLLDWIRHARSFAASFYLLNKSALLGRSFVPPPRKRLFVETVGYCNLECKFCSYPKKVRPRAVMDDALFRRVIDEAGALGYRHIVLTPITGDVFMDKAFIDRLRLIERSPIESFEFYSNFIGADERSIASLLAMSKLSSMVVSVYGHDRDSFRNITGRGDSQYRRLVDNLAVLRRLWPESGRHVGIVVTVRSYRSFDLDAAEPGELVDAIRDLRRLGAVIGVTSRVDNWGGLIGHDDIADIDMSLTDGRFLYRKGPCGLPFDAIQITAEGKVNACACRDPHGELAIGDARTTPLTNILSRENDKWTGIIADQEAGRFNSVCAACGLYRSILDERRTRDPEGPELVTKERYLALFAGDGRRDPTAGP